MQSLAVLDTHAKLPSLLVRSKALGLEETPSTDVKARPNGTIHDVEIMGLIALQAMGLIASKNQSNTLLRNSGNTPNTKHLGAHKLHVMKDFKASVINTKKLTKQQANNHTAVLIPTSENSSFLPYARKILQMLGIPQVKKGRMDNVFDQYWSLCSTARHILLGISSPCFGLRHVVWHSTRRSIVHLKQTARVQSRLVSDCANLLFCSKNLGEIRTSMSKMLTPISEVSYGKATDMRRVIEWRRPQVLVYIHHKHVRSTYLQLTCTYMYRTITLMGHSVCTSS